MGTRGLEIVRFNRRYYIRYNRLDSYYEGLGAKIVARIPTDPNKYQEWLQSMREKYATKERALDALIYTIHNGVKPDYSQFSEFVSLPSEIPRLHGYDAEYIYVINLDHEVLTMNYGIHWKLSNIPRENDLWLDAIEESIYMDKPTISLQKCPEEHMASLALELRAVQRVIEYDYRQVYPKTDITEGRKAFLTHLLANTILQYKDEITNFGREWSPDSFPFRELTFALVSIASGQAKFHSFPAMHCNPRKCESWTCNADHLPKSPGWLNKRWAGDSAPLLEFGSLSHRPGDPPGVSPAETIYWLDDVVVSLSLVVDGGAINEAVEWGLQQGQDNFQIVVLSLFKVAFVEVTSDDDGIPFVKCSGKLGLSPLHEDYCMSTHPRKRPEAKPGMQIKRRCGERILNSNCTGTIDRLGSQFPSLAAMVNFFEVAANRRAASKSEGTLRSELYDRILDYVDYDTWKACLLVSTAVRGCCLRKYRLDDRIRIVAGPFIRLQKHINEPLISFDFEDMQTGKILPMKWYPRVWNTLECNWMPVIGSDRKAVMVDVCVQYEPAEDEPVEVDKND
ncbi:hypothetical protein CBS147343_10884 [Aspergillus niger]|nr:hypothetical protein CBS12448_10662 [Aspergillus niger]KAI2841495.1 hypothetical protein CBS11350_6329 [Aspergillus niger]KAI2865703.1 hypothetical protein CBS13152_11048 [Aspergillus niger]KAI2870928.1 hypothetical protein CBS11852_11050 [Aspergillus niger]KAI2912385.1 hypothetical protein CBS147320_10902 [Aspergillus niger]